MASILVTVSLPTTRQDGTPVSPTDISEVDILRSTVTGGVAGAFVKIASVTTGITGPTVSYVDAAITGGDAYEYEADCIDTQTPPVTGAVSAATAAVSVPLVLAALSAPSVSASLQ